VIAIDLLGKVLYTAAGERLGVIVGVACENGNWSALYRDGFGTLDGVDLYGCVLKEEEEDKED
jgi:hypothetical protein